MKAGKDPFVSSSRFLLLYSFAAPDRWWPTAAPVLWPFSTGPSFDHESKTQTPKSLPFKSAWACLTRIFCDLHHPEPRLGIAHTDMSQNHFRNHARSWTEQAGTNSRQVPSLSVKCTAKVSSRSYVTVSKQRSWVTRYSLNSACVQSHR